MSGPAGHANIPEQAALVEELRQKYVEEDDARTASAVEQLLCEASRTSHEICNDARDLIQKLVRENEHTRMSAQYPEEESAHLQRLSELSATRDAVQQGLEAAKQQTRLVEEEHIKLHEGQQALREQQDLVHDLVNVQEPQARYMLSLYMHISRLNWRFGEQHVVSGTVSDPHHKDIRHFDIDTRYCSQFDTVQQIWNTMS